MRDARQAGDDAILVDERAGTLIVIGPKGRAHAFTPDGRHVTSLTLVGEDLEKRKARKRWRPATREEIRTVRAAVAQS